MMWCMVWRQTAVESLREVVRLWRVDCLPRQSRLYFPEGQNLAQIERHVRTMGASPLTFNL